jgi:hypothetical protein
MRWPESNCYEERYVIQSVDLGETNLSSIRSQVKL